MIIGAQLLKYATEKAYVQTAVVAAENELDSLLSKFNSTSPS